MPPAAQDDRHTLLLVQYNNSAGSRTFLDFESQPAAMDGICGLYEKELKALNPAHKNITYDVADLYTYLDQLTDISCLVCVHVQHASFLHTYAQPRYRTCACLLCVCPSQVSRAHSWLLAAKQRLDQEANLHASQGADRVRGTQPQKQHRTILSLYMVLP